MDQSRARKIVKQAAPIYVWALQLREWKIDIVWGHIASDKFTQNVQGRCATNPDYRAAVIELDAGEFGTKKELLHVLQHEMLHILHAEFSLLRRHWEASSTPEAQATFEDLSSHAVEVLVGRIERMLEHGLGLDAKAFLKLAQAHEEECLARDRKDSSS